MVNFMLTIPETTGQFQHSDTWDSPTVCAFRFDSKCIIPQREDSCKRIHPESNETSRSSYQFVSNIGVNNIGVSKTC